MEKKESTAQKISIYFLYTEIALIIAKHRGPLGIKKENY